MSGQPALRIAVVGSGPAGFYAAEALLANATPTLVDVYDALPAPFGLVRYGVAPDHPKIKNIIARYEKTAAHPGFAFLGNVTVGKDITVEEMRRYYDAIIFANGAQTDRRLGVPGEDLAGSYTATEFVAWYNGHPDYQGPRIRSVARMRRRDRAGQRGRGRGAHPVQDSRRAQKHRYHRACAGSARGIARARGAHDRPSRSGAGGVHASRDEGAG
jgi:NADPH-dependent glutamate synthase beta subunit-like oxidoreductase